MLSPEANDVAGLHSIFCFSGRFDGRSLRVMLAIFARGPRLLRLFWATP